MKSDYEVSRESFIELAWSGRDRQPRHCRTEGPPVGASGERLLGPVEDPVRSGACLVSGLQGALSLSRPLLGLSFSLWKVGKALCPAHFIGKEGSWGLISRFLLYT